MDEWQLKLAALDMAQNEGLTGPKADARAQQIYDWVCGRSKLPSDYVRDDSNG